MSDVINGVPRELLERLEHVTRNLAPHLKCHADLTALLTAKPQASADDLRKLSDLGNELHNLSCHVVHVNEGWAEQIGKIACELWKWPQASAAQSAPAGEREAEAAAIAEEIDWLIRQWDAKASWSGERMAELLEAAGKASEMLAAWQRTQSAGVPEELAAIGELIRTQDNRCTDQPLFVVMEKREIVTLDTHDHDRIVWVETKSGDYCEADDRQARRLELLYKRGRDCGSWERYAMKEIDVFVTACFTEQGCKDFLARDGHNHRKPFIYALGSYRNAEYQTVRNWLAAAPAQPAAQETCQACNGVGIVGHSELCPECKGAPQPTAQDQGEVQRLREALEWAVDRWHAEVASRPLVNVHRRALDDTWRQIIRRLGGDAGLLCGPAHDELLALAASTGQEE